MRPQFVRSAIGRRIGRALATLVTFILLLVGLTSVPAFAQRALNVTAGVDFVRVSHATALNPTGAITIEAWVRPTHPTLCHTIVGKSRAEGYWLGVCDGKIRFAPDGSESEVDGTTVIPRSEWSHVAVTFDGTTRRYYVNGILDLEEETPGPIGATLDNLGIGGEDRPDSLGYRYEFEGQISLVRIWSVARSEAEIRRDIIRAVGLEGTRPPFLLAQWVLDGNDVDSGPSGFRANFSTFPRFVDIDTPMIDHDPIRLPTNPPPVLDGKCEAGEYAGVRVPVWRVQSDQTFLHWIEIAATSTDIWMCAEFLPFRSGPESPVELRAWLLPSEDPGQETYYAFSVDEDGITESFPSIPFGAAVDRSLEFFWSAEMRIPRSIISAPDAEFRMLPVLRYDLLRFALYPFGAPPPFFNPEPKTLWETFRIPPLSSVRSDSAPPSVSVTHSPLSPRRSDQVTIEAAATDDIDLAEVAIFIDRDSQPAAVCDAFGFSDYESSCVARRTFPPGLHTYRAVATDHRGRTGVSAAGSLRVIVDGEAPRIYTSFSPVVAGSVALNATVIDDGGVARIRITADGGRSRECVISTSARTAMCSLSAPVAAVQRWLSFLVEATDIEDFKSSARRVWVRPTSGPDSDSDGIPDELERGFRCLDPNNPDSDGDALPDGWEVLNLNIQGAGVVDLVNMGADPCRKDVFVQYDYEKGARVDPGAIEMVVASFRDHGFTLHITENERPRPQGSDESPLTPAAAMYQRDGNGQYYWDPKLNWTHYYAYSRHIGGRSSASVKLMDLPIYGYPCNCPLSEPDPSRCRNGLPNPGCNRGDVVWQATTFQHELGHVLGLGHGGRMGARRQRWTGPYLWYEGNWDSSNLKPNDVSIMNYWTYSGLRCLLPPQPGAGPEIVGEITFSGTNLGDLLESSLDERPDSSFAVALRGQPCRLASDGAVPLVQYTCSDPDESGLGGDQFLRYQVISDGRRTVFRAAQMSGWQLTNLPDQPEGIDWDCDGNISPSVSSNINGDGGEIVIPYEPCGDGQGSDLGCNWNPDERLTGQDEWSVIPDPNECLKLYSARLQPDGTYAPQCYTQPLAYRSAMGTGAPDCRTDADFSLPDEWTGTGECLEFPASASTEGSYVPFPGEYEGLPGVEICNDLNDDGDDEIDEGCRDTDADGSSDGIDNCPQTPNADQADRNRNYLGDACENPGPVEGLTVSEDESVARVSWDGGARDVSGFNVYRQGGGDPNLVLLGLGYPSVRPDGSSYSDILPGSGHYRYYVRALDLMGVEGPDAVVALSAGVAPCTGDCDGQGVVEVSELVTMVSISLGQLPPSACVFDGSGAEGQITVGQVVGAVTNALNGCP